MEFQIPSNSIKTFAKALQTLNRIGPDAYFSVSHDQLDLISYNDSKSAYSSFKFASWFFETYYLSNIPAQGTNNTINFKVNFKPLLSVFRFRGKNPNKAIQKCIVKIDDSNFSLNTGSTDLEPTESLAECRIVVEIHQKAGVVKTYRMTYEVVDTLQPIYDKNKCANRFVIDPKSLKDNINYFSKQLDEISFCMTEKHILIRSWASGSLTDNSENSQVSGLPNGIRDYVETSRSLAGDANRNMQTELYMESEEFEHYQLTSNSESQSQSQSISQIADRSDPDFTELSFALRDLKAIVQYAESANVFLQAFFDNSGDPIIFVVSDELPLGGGSKKRRRPDNQSNSTNSGTSDASSKDIAIEGVNAEFIIATVPEVGTSSQYHTQSTIKAIQRMRKLYSESQSVSQSQSQPQPEPQYQLYNGNHTPNHASADESGSEMVSRSGSGNLKRGANVVERGSMEAEGVRYDQGFLVPAPKQNVNGGSIRGNVLSHISNKNNPSDISSNGSDRNHQISPEHSAERDAQDSNLSSRGKKVKSRSLSQMHLSISSDTESMSESVGKLYNANNNIHNSNDVNENLQNNSSGILQPLLASGKMGGIKKDFGSEAREASKKGENHNQVNNNIAFSQNSQSRFVGLAESDSMLQTPLSVSGSLHVDRGSSTHIGEMNEDMEVEGDTGISSHQNRPPMMLSNLNLAQQQQQQGSVQPALPVPPNKLATTGFISTSILKPLNRSSTNADANVNIISSGSLNIEKGQQPQQAKHSDLKGEESHDISGINLNSRSESGSRPKSGAEPVHQIFSSENGAVPERPTDHIHLFNNNSNNNSNNNNNNNNNAFGGDGGNGGWKWGDLVTDPFLNALPQLQKNEIATKVAGSNVNVNVNIDVSSSSGDESIDSDIDGNQSDDMEEISATPPSSKQSKSLF